MFLVVVLVVLGWLFSLSSSRGLPQLLVSQKPPPGPTAMSIISTTTIIPGSRVHLLVLRGFITCLQQSIENLSQPEKNLRKTLEAQEKS